MPALLTHDCFGRDVLDRDGGTQGGRSPLCPAPLCPEPAAEFAAELRHAFLLGNQGPDPFFFALRTPRLGTIKRFGSLMHRERVSEAVEAFCRLACAQPGPAGSLLHAYLLGFVCHFMLDSVMHPFVYAQQYAICDAGVKGLDRRDGSVVHGQIEADLDAMLVRQRRGESIRTYRYPHDVLRAGDDTLALLDAAFDALAHEVYAVNLPPAAFSRGVYDMRLTIAALYSPRGIKRSLIGTVERLFARHSLTQAMSPRADVGLVCDFDNRGHEAWKNPFTGDFSRASFDELYEQALGEAHEAIAALLAVKDGGGSVCGATITRGLNFEGAPQ